jgi:Bacterial protein of unknown function (DUF899)
MSTSTINQPQIVSRDEWLAARKRLLAREKELTRHRGEVNAERRRLPMIEITLRFAARAPASTQRALGSGAPRRDHRQQSRRRRTITPSEPTGMEAERGGKGDERPPACEPCAMSWGWGGELRIAACRTPRIPHGWLANSLANNK